MPPKKRIKEIIINKETNDIIEKHFGGEISLIKGTKLTKLFDEGLITNQMLKFLKAAKRYHNKSENGDIELKITYELEEPSKIIIDDALNDILKEHFESKFENIKGSTLQELLKDNKINKTQQNIFIKLKKASKKDNFEELIEYDLKEVEEEPKVEEEEGEVEEVEEDADVIASPDEIKESKYIIPHRKAFVNFVNQGFYKQVLKETQNQTDDLKLNVYQNLVKEYLSIESPYRGLLVYHGLGTGKTATAVSMAESVSKDMRITTLLPASLENNFIGEVKLWGKDELDLKGSHWKFIPLSDIEDTAKIRKDLLKQYGVTTDIIREIINHTIREVKKKISSKLAEEDPDIRNRKKDLLKLVNERYKKISKKVLETKGFWKHGKGGKDGKHGSKYDELEPYQKIFLECQIHRLIQLKYNFIHYNPLPTILKEDEIEKKDISDEEDDDELFEDEVVNKRSNEAIKQDLLKRLRYNIKHHDVESPFYNETIIIDEVHNFVREVLNDSGSSPLFYKWLVNAENVKLVFLSGTPIINKPCEIAVLYNMLKGRIKLYRFTIKSNEDPIDLTSKLNDIFYKKHSSIELFHIARKEGKLVI